jgi:tetratricopeptide (TPR) repeat protein
MRLQVAFFALCTAGLALGARCQTLRIAEKEKALAAATNSAKFDALNNLLQEHQSMFRDSLDARSLRLYTWSLQATDALAKAKGCLAMAYDYAAWGWADSSVWISEIGLRNLQLENASHRPVYFLLLRQQALMLGGRSQYSKALTKLYKLLQLAERYGDTATIASTQNTPGSVALACGQLSEARQWFTKALATCPALPAVPDVRAAILTNMANLLVNQQQEEAATPLQTEALALAQKVVVVYNGNRNHTP